MGGVRSPLSGYGGRIFFVRDIEGGGDVVCLI